MVTDYLREQFRIYLKSGETLVIDGDLTIDDRNLTAMPFLRVRGNLVFRDLRLHRIWGLEVAGDCTIERCDFIEVLPRTMVVGKKLTLRSNTLLALLGDSLLCRALEVDGCNSITSLELGIEQCRSVHIKHCKNLELLTHQKTMWGPSDLTIEHAGLRNLPSELTVGTNLRVACCDDLELCGPGLMVGGSADFTGLKNLRSIGTKAFIGQNLILRDTGLEMLPEDIEVGDGYIEVDENCGIRNLKEIQAAGTEVRWRGRNLGMHRI